MFSVLCFFFPFVDIFAQQQAMYYVSQIITLSGLSLFIFDKLFQAVFPSLGWSSCFPLSSCRDDKSWVPLGSSSGSSFLALRGNSQGLARCHFLLCLDKFVMLYVSIFSSASLDYIQSSNSCSWLDVLSVSFSNEILLFRSHSSFVLSSFLDSLVASLISLS